MKIIKPKHRVNLEDIHLAQEQLRGVARWTPLDHSATFSRMVGCEVFLKEENMQRTGSFKLRGAYKAVLDVVNRGEKKVVAASAGNHAQGVALAAKILGVQATLVMPRGAPAAKVMATRGYGANVVLSGDDYQQSYQSAQKLTLELGATMIHAFDDPAVVAGQATVGLEILHDLPEVDVVVVPAGGGGLAAGIALVIKEQKPKARVIAVQAASAPALALSFRAGHIIEAAVSGTVADGIAVRKPGELTFDLCRRYLDEVITVSEEEIASAMLIALERAKKVVEGAGAAGLAALLADRVLVRGQKVAVVLSGGNVDMSTISQIIERGLVRAGRYARIRVLLSDRPGALRDVLAVVADSEANIMSVSHERLGTNIPFGRAEVVLNLETRDRDHLQRVVQNLRNNLYSAELIT